MRCLVTGGAGFIGSHIADALVEIGNDVLVVDDLSRGRRENIPASASFSQTDIVSAEIERVIGEFEPNAVFHLAAQMDVRQSVADPAFDAGVNIQGTIRVANAAAQAGCGALFFSSTGGAIYGEQMRFPADEDHPCRSESPYGVSKRCAEIYLDLFSRTTGMRSVALRYANVYGPRQDPHGEAGVVAIFAKKMLAGEPPTVFGDGEQTRDYVYVDDVVKANLLALRHNDAVGEINIGTGIEMDLNQLAASIAKAASYKGEIQYADAKPGEQRRSALDIGRAGELLHWKPAMPLEQGIEETVSWFAKQMA